VRTWEFLPVVGQRAALFGHETGRFEAWVYPLKILRDFHFRFLLADHSIPAEALARTVVVRPESATIIYAGDDFSVRETFFVPVHEQGAIVSFDIDTAEPIEVEAAFTPDFSLEWPAALGATYFKWDSQRMAFLFGEESKKYAAIVGSPTATNSTVAYDTNYSASTENTFRLGRIDRGKQAQLIVIAGSAMGEEDAIRTYRTLTANSAALVHDSAQYYRDYLARTVSVDIPDESLKRAYDWSRVSTIQGLVQNPDLGAGLVAGYRTSGTSQRPGFAWFFGRDSIWSSFALNASGDFSTTRQALEFIAKFQRQDGRIPHEVAQTANLVDWFHAYPFAFASADATPLFIIGISDYVTQSGDIEFARAHWDQLSKAYQFLRSTYNDNGFPRNFGVGHGWVEGGPLLPVETEYYQSGLGAEALRSLAMLAKLVGKNDISSELTQQFEQQKSRVEQAFWSSEHGIYAFALDRAGSRIDETSVLATVPMWFGLSDAGHAAKMTQRLASPGIAADWGMRIIDIGSAHYNGGGYHYGSVWPLFTGWAATGEYRYHQPSAAYANLRANALLALNGSLGHTTEVLSGDVFESLSTSSPHQIWSAAMVVSPLLRGLFGLEADAPDNRLTFTPHIPANWNNFALHNVRVGATSVDLSMRRSADLVTLEVKASAATTVRFAPALSLRTEVLSADLNGRKVPFHLSRNDYDQHVEVDVPVSTTPGTLTLQVKRDFAVSYDNPLPELGAPSLALRVLSETWNSSHSQLALMVAGVPGHSYTLQLLNAGQISRVVGARLVRGSTTGAGALIVDVPGSGSGFVTRSLILDFSN
jgi:glycogen debranching enzyme